MAITLPTEVAWTWGLDGDVQDVEVHKILLNMNFTSTVGLVGEGKR
jgi:hypothetical protein